MGLDVIIDNFLIEILSSLIVASIIGAASSFAVLIRCVHKQANDIALMKKATAIVFKLIATDTKRLHGNEHGMSDLDDIYKALVKDE